MFFVFYSICDQTACTLIVFINSYQNMRDFSRISSKNHMDEYKRSELFLTFSKNSQIFSDEYFQIYQGQYNLLMSVRYNEGFRI
jgi:hypothetical protein